MVPLLLLVGFLSVLGLAARLGYPSMGRPFVAVMGVGAVLVAAVTWRQARAGRTRSFADAGRSLLLIGALCVLLWLAGVVLFVSTDLDVPPDALALLLVPCLAFLAAGLVERSAR